MVHKVQEKGNWATVRCTLLKEHYEVNLIMGTVGIRETKVPRYANNLIDSQRKAKDLVQRNVQDQKLNAKGST